jgi:hypothetical protein
MPSDSGVRFYLLDCDGFSKEVYNIQSAGEADTATSFTEMSNTCLKRSNCKESPVIIDVKVIDMDQNHHEIDQILRYWPAAWSALPAVRRCSEWVGLERSSVPDKPQSVSSADMQLDCRNYMGRQS